MREIEEQNQYNTKYVINVDDKFEEGISNIKTYERCGLSLKDFCNMIPELNQTDLSSVKNLDGVVIIDTMLDSGLELNLEDGSDIEINLTSISGKKVRKVIKDCYIVSRCLEISKETGAVLERVTIVSGNVRLFDELTN